MSRTLASFDASAVALACTQIGQPKRSSTDRPDPGLCKGTWSTQLKELPAKSMGANSGVAKSLSRPLVTCNEYNCDKNSVRLLLIRCPEQLVKPTQPSQLIHRVLVDLVV